jgi:hypothetical protein
VNVAYGASAYVPVSFDNLISRVAFSQQFFEPSLGQTQQVTASFAVNVNWTLQMIDEDSNIVRTVTGSGPALSYNWDGTGDGGTNLSPGIYYYLITALTNGQPFQMQGGASGSGGGSPPSPASASLAGFEGATEPFVLLPGGGAVPLMLYPPGIDTNGFVIFESTMQEVFAPRISVANAVTGTGTGADPEPAYSGPASESTAAPTRPPTAPVRGANGKYGAVYFDFPTPQSFRAPPNG